MLKKLDINLNPVKLAKTIEVLWSPPLLGWIKCNTDGVVSGNPKLAACGAIFWDHNANHLFSFCNFFGYASTEDAELVGVLMAMEEAKKRKITELWIESDNMFLVNAFKNRSLAPWNLLSCWLVCLDYSTKIDFMISHIYKEANFCANFLANLGLKSKKKIFCS